MKMCRLRVVVPADNTALLNSVQERLRELLTQAGSEHLPARDPKPGEEADLIEGKPGPRVFWLAAEVLQGDERGFDAQRRSRPKETKETKGKG